MSTEYSGNRHSGMAQGFDEPSPKRVGAVETNFPVAGETLDESPIEGLPNSVSHAEMVEGSRKRSPIL